MVIQTMVNFVNEAEIFFYLLSPDWNKVFARGGTAAKEGIVRLGGVFFWRFPEKSVQNIKWLILIMAKQPFEDVSPFKNDDFPLPC